MIPRGQWYYYLPCQKARGDEAQGSTTQGILEKRLLGGPVALIKHITRWPEAHMLVLMGPMRWVQPMAASHGGTFIHRPSSQPANLDQWDVNGGQAYSSSTEEELSYKFEMPELVLHDPQKLRFPCHRRVSTQRRYTGAYCGVC